MSGEYFHQLHTACASIFALSSPPDLIKSLHEFNSVLNSCRRTPKFLAVVSESGVLEFLASQLLSPASYYASSHSRSGPSANESSNDNGNDNNHDGDVDDSDSNNSFLMFDNVGDTDNDNNLGDRKLLEAVLQVFLTLVASDVIREEYRYEEPDIDLIDDDDTVAVNKFGAHILAKSVAAHASNCSGAPNLLERLCTILLCTSGGVHSDSSNYRVDTATYGAKRTAYRVMRIMQAVLTSKQMWSSDTTAVRHAVLACLLEYMKRNPVEDEVLVLNPFANSGRDAEGDSEEHDSDAHENESDGVMTDADFDEDDDHGNVEFRAYDDDEIESRGDAEDDPHFLRVQLRHHLLCLMIARLCSGAPVAIAGADAQPALPPSTPPPYRLVRAFLPPVLSQIRAHAKLDEARRSSLHTFCYSVLHSVLMHCHKDDIVKFSLSDEFSKVALVDMIKADV